MIAARRCATLCVLFRAEHRNQTAGEAKRRLRSKAPRTDHYEVNLPPTGVAETKTKCIYERRREEKWTAEQLAAMAIAVRQERGTPELESIAGGGDRPAKTACEPHHSTRVHDHKRPQDDQNQAAPSRECWPKEFASRGKPDRALTRRKAPS